jgi:CubicO group peptidase (beta-lactamase class C family)
LKFILEKVYKKSFDKILESYINRPLLMGNTNSLFSKNNSKQLAWGYSEKGNLMPYNPPLLDAAGGIYSTVPDMLNYLKFHLDETNEVVDMSHRVVFGNLRNYAIGLNWQEQITARKNKKLWQSGGTFGFSSYCVIYPELKIAIVMLTNESDQRSQGEMEEMADKIFEKLNQK